ncbi:uncharacterized protein Z519_09633 [Cladophialophora bantiana CBS 173.52]|uniref:EthD domain-containing protein n=1 Tax=Cladophialophora bantiana (strain ATCC 10958 / CBS 173.52 / CDC B-1940 / NIH 8579) TaxID=1442370 RepID=A0A0D2FSE8_CLAB1|nr:uncharacterized protein Z519_09633 [Cladophialophora bantiana CBS 173.52]KIW89477.1 hypothetical protein Z519_09633 [Cladophialophora bantiana CBS 173.52]
MATKQRMVKLSLFARRKDSLSEDEFQEYWSGTHKALATEWLAKYGIVRYTQYHTPSKLVSSAVAGFPVLQNAKKLDFDGVGEFLMPEISCFQRAREDPYYTEVIAPDEDKLFDWGSVEWTVGWEEVYIKDGKVVDLPFGDNAEEVAK